MSSPFYPEPLPAPVVPAEAPTPVRAAKQRKPLGIGSVALLLIMLYVPFTLSFNGSSLLSRIIPIQPALGIVSFVFPISLLCAAVLIGHRYSQHFGARIGKHLGIAFLSFNVFVLVFTAFFAGAFG